MSNLEVRPPELECTSAGTAVEDRPAVEVLEPREVPLGGPRAMQVRRTLPHRRRSLIGGWCFVDHYGPDDVADSGGMTVPPHPHTGLQTVSWLFTGEVEHRDSAGHHAMVWPGEMNLMTAGRGISHSEVSTAQIGRLHGVQLWVALPDASRFTEPAFEHYVPEPVFGAGYVARVFVGSVLGQTSPVRAFSPLLGAEIRLDAGASLRFPVPAGFEHGVLVDTGSADVFETPVERGQLAHVAAGQTELQIAATGAEPVRIILLGGEPLGESIVMWWNFIGRSHEEIVAFRARWQAEIDAAAGGDVAAGAEGDAAPMFGMPVDDPLPPLPAPALPNSTLRPRQ